MTPERSAPRSRFEMSLRKKFDTYTIRFFHIPMAEVSAADGNLYLFVAIDRTTKFGVIELVERTDMPSATTFLWMVPSSAFVWCYGIQFADMPKYRQGQPRFRKHPFDRLCHHHEIDPAFRVQTLNVTNPYNVAFISSFARNGLHKAN